MASAATITVTTTDDDNPSVCTLRDAIAAANFNFAVGGCPAGDSTGTDTIDINATGTINLGSALPSLTSNITINGLGSGQLDVHRQTGGAYRIFTISGSSSVVIADLTVSGGSLDSIGQAGAGIAVFSPAQVTLDHVVVTDNHLTNTSDSLNPAAQGGGILNAGTMTIRRSTVSGNTITSSQTAASGATSADALGAGIENQGTITVIRSTVTGNTATATVTSTDPSASAFARGGGFDNWTGGTAAIRLSTISGNQAIANATSPATSTTRGGGVANFFGPQLDVISSTIAFNTGQLSANLWSQGTDTVANTIISNPVGGPNCDDTVDTDDGTNLVFPGGCAGLTPLTADPLLQPLDDNGGATETHALGWPSPALDAGSSQSDTTDQRDLARPVDIPTITDADDGADIGAVEMATDSTPPIDPTVDSPSHDVNVGSKDRTVDVTWTGASDVGFGLDGYSFEWSSSPTTVPDQTKDAEESATGTTSPSLPDGTSHWFHLRTGDNAGNWTSTVHLGPFVIDATAPETTFTKVPRKRIETEKARVRVRFAFTASEPSTFGCKLDKKPLAACSSPRRLKVKPGRHRFSAQSTDQLGNTDATPTVHKFRVVKA